MEPRSRKLTSMHPYDNSYTYLGGINLTQPVKPQISQNPKKPSGHTAYCICEGCNNHAKYLSYSHMISCDCKHCSIRKSKSNRPVGGICSLVSPQKEFKLELDTLVHEKWLKRERHPNYPLYIYSVTRKTINASNWNKYTEMCNGLVLDENGDIKSKLFGKIPNFNEFKVDASHEKKKLEGYTKIDGIAIGVFSYGNDLIAHTKDSFYSYETDYVKEIHGKLIEFVRGNHLIKNIICELVLPKDDDPIQRNMTMQQAGLYVLGWVDANQNFRSAYEGIKHSWNGRFPTKSSFCSQTTTDTADNLKRIGDLIHYEGLIINIDGVLPGYKLLPIFSMVSISSRSALNNSANDKIREYILEGKEAILANSGQGLHKAINIKLNRIFDYTDEKKTRIGRVYMETLHKDPDSAQFVHRLQEISKKTLTRREKIDDYMMKCYLDEDWDNLLLKEAMEYCLRDV